MAKLISDKIDFIAKKITRDNGWHYDIIKEAIHQDGIAILNVYGANRIASKYMRYKLIELKGEIDKKL